MANSRYFPTLGTDFGSASSYATYNLSSLPPNQVLGIVVESTSGAVYRLVQFDKGSGSVAGAAGMAVHWKTRASYIVTADQTDAEASLNSVAGGLLGTPTDQYYVWIQIGGKQTGVSVAAGTAVGDQLSGSATDGQLAKTAVSTAAVNQIVAIAYSAVSGGTSTVYWSLGALL